MRLKTLGDDHYCQDCKTEVTVVCVEYDHNSPERYDGTSEYQCGDCGRREGRWTGKQLAEGEVEKRYGGQS